MSSQRGGLPHLQGPGTSDARSTNPGMLTPMPSVGESARPRYDDTRTRNRKPVISPYRPAATPIVSRFVPLPPPDPA